MGYLTESHVSSIIDIPISLPSTELKQGDWVVLASYRIVQPMRIEFRYLNIEIISSSVTIGDITSVNRISANLGLVYVALRIDYSAGSDPGAGGALDLVTASALGITSRDHNSVLSLTTPGTYTWIVANNCQPSSEETSLIPATTSIDFRASVTGTARLYLE